MHAGIFIAIAAILYVRCPNQIVGSFLFSIGLLACLIFQADLCTGQAHKPWHELYHPYTKLRPRWVCWMREQSLWLILYVINCWFALVIGIWARFCIDVTAANELVAAKIAHPWYWILFMGFLCGVLIQIAVHAWGRSRGGLPVVVMCVAAFLLLGGEHCVADAAFIGMQDSGQGLQNALGVVKLVGLAGLGNLLAGALFYTEH